MSAPILHIGEKAIHAHEVPFLLSRYRLIPQIIRNIILDEAIASYSCTEEERMKAIAIFEKHHQIASPEARQAWLQSQVVTLEQMEDMAIRPVKIEKFKSATWGCKVESYFLTRKASLDQVIYSLIRTKDMGIAHEIYFRIQEGEQSFAELARDYSEGLEAHTGGFLGPVPLSQLHPAISKLLSISKPYQLWSPRALGEWFVIVRLEKLIPAQLDEMMCRRLINELFETWLQEQIKKFDLQTTWEFLTA